MLPNFLIIGAAKSGTTWLHEYVGEHPDVFVSRKKEPGFFAFENSELDFRGPGDEWLRHYTTTIRADYEENFSDVGDESAVGEASPPYLYYPDAAARIRVTIPDARLIAILRHPVERAYSQFLFMQQCGREPLWDFAAALEAEDYRIRQHWEYGWHYVRLGFYYRQLKRYYDLFPGDQIRVYLFEDLQVKPVELLRDVYRFLGVDDDFQSKPQMARNVTTPPRNRLFFELLRKQNPVRDLARRLTSVDFRKRVARSRWFTRLTKKKPPMDPAVAERLARNYREDIHHLQDLIDRDLSHWLTRFSSTE